DHYPSSVEHSETTRSAHVRQRSNRRSSRRFRRKNRVQRRLETFVCPRLRFRHIAGIQKLRRKRREIHRPAPRPLGFQHSLFTFGEIHPSRVHFIEDFI